MAMHGDGGGSTSITASADLSLTAGVLGRAKGTSFPGSPTTGDIYFRTDRIVEYYYDGTRWLSTQLFTVAYNGDDVGTTATVSSRIPFPFTQAAYDIYIVDLQTATNISTATTASNYYSMQLVSFEASGSTSTNIGSALLNQNDTQNVWTKHSEAIGVVVANTIETLTMTLTKVGTATMRYSWLYTYRLVG